MYEPYLDAYSKQTAKHHDSLGNVTTNWLFDFKEILLTKCKVLCRQGLRRQAWGRYRYNDRLPGWPLAGVWQCEFLEGPCHSRNWYAWLTVPDYLHSQCGLCCTPAFCWDSRKLAYPRQRVPVIKARSHAVVLIAGEITYSMWFHQERTLGSLGLVSSGLCQSILFLCWFWFVPFHCDKWQYILSPVSLPSLSHCPVRQVILVHF